MSLLSKFTNLFKQKDELNNTFARLFKPSSQNDLNHAMKNLSSMLSKQSPTVFALLRQRETPSPSPENLLNLLLVIHQNIGNEEVCDQLRQSPIFWIDQLMNENRESFMLIERMITEQSTNSFFPQQIVNQQQTQSKGEKLEDKRKARIQMNQQLQSPIMNTEAANNTDTQNLQPKMFCIIYYSFLQKLSINQLVYQSCKKLQNPDDEDDDNIHWLYKIQNVMQMGLKLLQCTQKKYKLYQSQIYQDLFYFQTFLKEQLECKIKDDKNLQIYEIYCEYQRAKQILEQFNPLHSFTLKIISSILDEFQRNAIKEKVKVQFAQNKKNKVIEDQENIDQLNFQDFESNHDFEREIVMKKYFDQSKSNQMSLDEITLQLKINTGLN